MKMRLNKVLLFGAVKETKRGPIYVWVFLSWVEAGPHCYEWPRADVRTHTAFFELQDALNPQQVWSNTVNPSEEKPKTSARETLLPGPILSRRLKYLMIKASVNWASDKVGVSGILMLLFCLDENGSD